MKIIYQNIEKNGEGQVGFIAEEPDDLWLIFNMINVEDQVRATTQRKVINESATGSTGAFKVTLTLSVSVEKVEYDQEYNFIKVKGKTIEENKHVRRGQYHTLDLELNKKFYLTKPVWDALAISQLNECRHSGNSAEVAVAIMQEGLCYVCLLTNMLTVQKAKIEVNIPRKRRNFCSQHQKGLESFYDQILQAIVRHINFGTIKCIIIASPGFIKDQFLEYLWKQASSRSDLKQLLDSRHKFLAAHSSTGFKHSIRELMTDPIIQTRLEDTKSVQEMRIWNQFQELLGSEPGRAVYGLSDVEMGQHHQAIEIMLLTDKLFRCQNLALRRKYSKLMYEVRSTGASVSILSSMHLSGQQLNQLTGIAAILRFEVPEMRDRLANLTLKSGKSVPENWSDDSDWSNSTDDEHNQCDTKVDE